jgi:general secretion pathway protein H
MRRRRGITLIELLITLSIASALLALVPPLLSKQLGRAGIERSARELTGALRSARSAAIAERRDIAVSFDLKSRSYRDHRGQQHALPSEPKIKLHTAQSEVIEKQTGNIRFFADGSATGGGLSLLGEKRGWRVDVDWLTGRVQMHAQAPQ